MYRNIFLNYLKFAFVFTASYYHISQLSHINTTEYKDTIELSKNQHNNQHQNSD